MRRKDRNVTDKAKISECLTKSDILHVGFNDNGKVYVVPVNFGFSENDGKYTLYFHGATEGRKAELAKTSPEVGFAAETNYSLVDAKSACGFTAKFLSVIGTGKLRLATSKEEKKQGLDAVMSKLSEGNWDYSDEILEKVNLYIIEVTELSCKENA